MIDDVVPPPTPGCYDVMCDDGVTRPIRVHGSRLEIVEIDGEPAAETRVYYRFRSDIDGVGWSLTHSQWLTRVANGTIRATDPGAT